MASGGGRNIGLDSFKDQEQSSQRDNQTLTKPGADHSKVVLSENQDLHFTTPMLSGMRL